ncbi:FHA domain-containing protein [bacterium]|nr:FHA domain-containing protein [bacterium]
MDVPVHAGDIHPRLAVVGALVQTADLDAAEERVRVAGREVDVLEVREVRLTTEHGQVLRRLERVSAWGQTTIWDAIYLAMEELVADSDPARRAVIVLSDGLDNKSLETPRTILQYYEESALEKNRGFSVYALGLGEEIDRSGLGTITASTGGLYLDSPTAEDLAGVYQDILNQIQSEYLLEYEAPGESTAGQIIDLAIGLTSVQSFDAGTYTYRSPGLSKALGRLLWPGLAAIAVILAILIIATIYKISRRVWLTVMITPLEGKDYPVGELGVDIGTAEICSVRVPGDPALLPLHASLIETVDGYLLEAADADSPIIVAERVLSRKLLRSGDRFTLGTTHFVFSEKTLRPGEGKEQSVAEVAASPAASLSEQAQLASAGGAAQPAEAGKIPSTLVALSGPLAGQRFTLSEGENAIGRSEGTILLAADTQASRRHCTVTLANGVATLVDLGSSNGTRLGGVPCQPGIPQPVYSGDLLQIGSGEYRLE